MSDTAQFITMFLILAVACGYVWYSYARQKRVEKRRKADEDFRQHRGGGPR